MGGSAWRPERALGSLALAVVAGLLAALWLTGHLEGDMACRGLGTCAGLLPGMLSMRGHWAKAAPPLVQRLAMTAFIAVSTIIIGCYPWLRYRDYGPHAQYPRHFHSSFDLATSLCIAPVAMACTMSWHPPSSYARKGVWCVVGLWLAVLLWTMDNITRLATPGNPVGALGLWHAFVLSVALHVEGSIVVWIAVLVVRRNVELQQHDNFASRHSRLLIGLMGSAFHGRIMAETFFGGGGMLNHVLYVFLAVAFLIIWLFYTGYLACSLVRSLRLLHCEVRRVSGVPRAEAAWAAQVLRCELIALVAIGITTASVWTLMLAYRLLSYTCPSGCMEASHDLITAVIVVHRADLAVNACSMAVFSGVLWQTGPSLEGAPPLKHDRPVEATEAFSTLGDAAWDAKVEELAGRGFELGALLDFWALLLEGRVMPSFNPHRSTTQDVVRQAIIPLSRDEDAPHGGRALASVWNCGRHVPAARMVTHNWSNIFLHLVAAIVADGLDRGCYDAVATLLASRDGLRLLAERLRSSGTIGVTYWVCAFSVNQHASICGGFGPAPPVGTAARAEWETKIRDTVTGSGYAVCPCSEQKFFNDQPAPCELNKFDDMMRLLNKRVSGFSQLVVVDAAFNVFLRAWCVAEIVEAAISGIPQHIRLHSQEVLDQHYEGLAMLDVQDCQASRAEDKAMILAKIPDADAFNSHLQQIIFGAQGLFSEWVDGKARAEMIGRILRRATSGQSRASTATGSTATCSTASSEPSSLDSSSFDESELEV